MKKLLTELGIKYEIDSNMVRGLDYYTHTIFEIMSDSKVFDNPMTICAGGRYDGLIAQLGGPNEGGIGFGMGVERLILLLQEKNNFVDEQRLELFLISADKCGDDEAFRLLNKLREKGIYAEKSYTGNKIKIQIKEAIRKKAKYYTIIGKNELDKGEINLKKVDKDESQGVKICDMINNPDNYLM